MDSLSESDSKQMFIEKRIEFKINPMCLGDLEAYDNRDNTHNYTSLKGLIPPSLVGKKNPSGHDIWGKSDTFFTDYKENFPDQVLSETEDSFVIGNLESHDTRQYLAKWDLEGKDQTAKAGMSYMHLLVIPRRRVYNAVALNNTDIIEEMMAHFRRFWRNPESAEKINGFLKKQMDRRAKAVREALVAHNPDLVEEFDATMEQVRASTEELANKLCQCQKSQHDEVLFFGFHPAPVASIAHLHMHSLLILNEFRKFSTRVHDWKTIPASAIIDVILDERGTVKERKSRWK